MTKRTRLIAALMVLTVVFVMLFSVCLINAQTGHDCIGECCPICYQIHICEHTLKTIGCAAGIIVFAAFSVYSIVVLSSDMKKHSVNTTLVLLKVKLSN